MSTSTPTWDAGKTELELPEEINLQVEVDPASNLFDVLSVRSMQRDLAGEFAVRGLVAGQVEPREDLEVHAG